MRDALRSPPYAEPRIVVEKELKMTNDNPLARRKNDATLPVRRRSRVGNATPRSVQGDLDQIVVTTPEYSRKRRLRRRASDVTMEPLNPQQNATNIFRSSHEDTDTNNPAPVPTMRSESSNTFSGNVTVDASQLTYNPPQKHKPTPVAIAFGFILVALCVAGLGLYAYIFWRKRKKHLINKQRTSGMAVMGGAGPMSRKHPGAQHPHRLPPSRSAVTADQTSGQKSDDSSDGSSSYEGLDSASESDVFAKELKIAATLDRQAWESFIQRKTHYEMQKLERDEQIPISSTQTDGVKLYGGETSEGVEALHADSDRMFMTASPWQGLELVNSFPYGDEIPNSLSNLTPEDLMIRDVNPNGTDFLQQGASLDWAKKSASGSPKRDKSGRAVKSKDADEDSEEDLFFSLAPSHSQERNVPQLDGNGMNATTDTEASFMESRNEVEDERIDPETDDMIKEVQRLSLFVKKYEKKKEKRIRRVIEHHQQLHSHSTFDPDRSGVNIDEHPGNQQPYLSEIDEAGGGQEVLEFHQASLVRAAQAANARSGLRSMTFSKFQPQEGADDSEPDELDPPGQNNITALAFKGVNLADFSSDSDTDDDKDFFRLGITPFTAQRPGGPSPQDGAKVVEAALQSLNQGILMTDSSERYGDEEFFRTPSKTFGPDWTTDDDDNWGFSSQETKQPTKKQSLSALRFNESIIDNTNSEVPSSVLSPSDAAQLLAATEPTIAAKPNNSTNNSGAKSSKFANIVSLFESKPKEAVFPPNESWQFNS